MGEQKEVSLEELLAEQSKTITLATIETVPEKTDIVKVTPWFAGRGCMCSLALEVPKRDIVNVILSQHSHFCCDRSLRVVEVEFREGSVLPAADVFANLSRFASSELDRRRVRETNRTKWSAEVANTIGTLVEAAARGKSSPGSGPASPDGFIEIWQRIVRFGSCIAKDLEYGSINREQILACVEQFDDPL